MQRPLVDAWVQRDSFFESHHTGQLITATHAAPQTASLTVQNRKQQKSFKPALNRVLIPIFSGEAIVLDS